MGFVKNQSSVGGERWEIRYRKSIFDLNTMPNSLIKPIDLFFAIH
jgi:hypothetical protein